MDIEITQNIIDYIINNRSRFEMDIPKLGEKWNVESITTYSGVNCGNPVVELSNDNKDWMVLPKELLYQQLEDMLDESLSKETAESWNKRLESTCVSNDLEKAAKHYLYSNILYNDVYVGNPTDKDCIEMFKAGTKWQRKDLIEKACKWLKENATYIHPRKGTKECMINLTMFKEAMEE